MEARFADESEWVPHTAMYERAQADVAQARADAAAATAAAAAACRDKSGCMAELAQLRGEYENLRLTLQHSEVRSRLTLRLGPKAESNFC